MKTFTVALGSDHAGFAYKEAIKAMLLAEGHVVRDFGTHSDAACDYPDWIRPVAEAAGLGFLPVADEHYDFALWTDPRDPDAIALFEAALAEAAPDLARLGFVRG